MFKNQTIFIVLPAYNAASTLEKTYHEIPFDIVDEVLLCDDASSDFTIQIAHALGIRHIIKHDKNTGYGGNQKTLYDEALKMGADIIVMLHPDYQYTPKLIAAMVSLIGEGLFDVVLGSRILGIGALEGGMPRYKYMANRVLTFVQNLCVGHKLSEFHTGYRAYHKNVLENINYSTNSDDFVFDNEVLSQIIYAGYSIGEISCPARYESDSSSINFRRSITYGIGVLKVSAQHLFQRWGLASHQRYHTKASI